MNISVEALNPVFVTCLTRERNGMSMPPSVLDPLHEGRRRNGSRDLVTRSDIESRKISVSQVR